MRASSSPSMEIVGGLTRDCGWRKRSLHTTRAI
eukprot:CAMPEP_0198695354 /NCGR_PEP_ID=MMETSP1468-20131203/286157_1 /TAXON_ID=1461545 /ORGANISM="Mantoniella sp, Strain CCMP1436" /LENGTH=32 /DNA_ID= /DNA_START= /DNA_END= /DNA_ORIENTATION=